jgi:hypothetical protein
VRPRLWRATGVTPARTPQTVAVQNHPAASLLPQGRGKKLLCLNRERPGPQRGAAAHKSFFRLRAIPCPAARRHRRRILNTKAPRTRIIFSHGVHREHRVRKTIAEQLVQRIFPSVSSEPSVAKLISQIIRRCHRCTQIKATRDQFPNHHNGLLICVHPCHLWIASSFSSIQARI